MSGYDWDTLLGKERLAKKMFQLRTANAELQEKVDRLKARIVELEDKQDDYHPGDSCNLCEPEPCRRVKDEDC